MRICHSYRLPFGAGQGAAGSRAPGQGVYYRRDRQCPAAWKGHGAGASPISHVPACPANRCHGSGTCAVAGSPDTGVLFACRKAMEQEANSGKRARFLAGRFLQEYSRKKRCCGTEQPLDAPDLHGLPVQHGLRGED